MKGRVLMGYRRYFFLLLITTCVILLAGCRTKEPEKDFFANEPPMEELKPKKPTESYVVIDKNYTEHGISITYPQVTGLPDDDLEHKINSLLENDALEGALRFYPDKTDLTMEVDYAIVWQGSRILSIKFEGYAYVEGAAHPNNLFYTSNIDVPNGKKIYLDEVAKIDENLLAKLRPNYVGSISEEQLPEVLDIILDRNALSLLEQADYAKTTTDSAYSYFTKDALGISLPAPYVLGSHVEFELPYREISDNLKPEVHIWSDFDIR